MTVKNVRYMLKCKFGWLCGATTKPSVT